MATSLQFGPEWMRKAPTKSGNASSNSIGASSTSSSSAAAPGAPGDPQPRAPGSSSSAAPGHIGLPPNRRNPSLGVLGTAQSPGVPTPVASPPAPSPGAFSFAAAAGGAASAQNHHSGSNAFGSIGGSSGSSFDRFGGGGGDDSKAKDPGNRYSKERLLSLYSSGGTLKSPAATSGGELSNSQDAAPPTPLSATPSSAGKKKPFADREGTRRSASAVLAEGGPMSPSIPAEPRGLNARGASVEARPGLFARGSTNSIPIGSVGSGSLSSGPPSAGATRERFAGIQGGVLSGVGPISRQRKSSENGTELQRSSRIGRQGSEDVGISPTPDAFSSVRSRSKASSEALDGAAPRHGESLSGRFRRERMPGEGPIGPNPDGSAGFGKFAGYSRRRERQASMAAGIKTGGDAEGGAGGSGELNRDGAGDLSSDRLGIDSSQDSIDQSQRSIDGEPDLTHHATQVLGSLKLDAEDVGGIGGAPPDLPAAAESETWSVEKQNWYYRDPSGQVQGPFDAVSMQDWHRQSYFAPDLLLRPEQAKEFRTLAEIISLLGDSQAPFLRPPPPEQPAAPLPSQTSDPFGRDEFGLPRGLGDSQQLQPQRQSSSQLGGFDAPQHGSVGGGFESGRDSPYGFAPPRDSWQAAGTPLANRHWGPQLDLGFTSPQHGMPLFNNGGPHSPFLGGVAPASPFGGPAHFAGNLEARIRQQEEYLALARQRELQERQQAAAAAAAAARERVGFGGAFGGGPQQFDDAFGSARPAWDQQPGAWNGTPIQQHRGPFHTGPMFDGVTPQVQQQHQSPSPMHQGARGATAWDGGAGLQQQRGAEELGQSPEQHHAEHEQQQQQQYESASQQQQYPQDAAPSQQAAYAHEPEQEVNAEAEPESAPHEEQPQAASKPDSSAPQELTAPEQLWPQDPKTATFAAEADTAVAPSNAQPAAAEDTAGFIAAEAARGKKAKKERKAAAAAAAGSDEAPAGEARRGAAAAKEEKTSTQVPISAWLPESGSPSPPPGPKVAPWAQSNRDEAGAASSHSVSLREIQEAEARKAEQRRAAERAAAAKARAALGSDSTAGKDSIPTSMTWGLALPGAAGKAAGSGPAAGGSDSAPGTPAWNAPATKPGAAKTLAEIQEEELKRAQKQRDSQAAQLAAQKRAYAESASRQASSGATAAQAAMAASTGGPGGAWSVVGAGGKVASSSPTPSPMTSRPPAAVAASTASTPQRAVSLGASVASPATSPWATKTAANGARAASPAQPVIAPAAVAKPKPSAPLDPSQPSPEFLRYCKEQLKGINIKVDDFIEMLLSFPLDPSPDVVEIIAESVYANSSTLDGRRFAADFVAQRKMDAQGRLSNRSPSSSFGNGGIANAPGALGGIGRSASEALKSGGSRAGGAGAGAGANDAFGFKVVKGKGGKKRN